MPQISEIMTRGVQTLAPHDSVIRAAQAMQELDVGSIPVCDGQRLVGIVTDRDIVLRAVAQDQANATTRLDEVMSPEVCWCYEDQSVDDVLQTMRDEQLRRIPVVDHDRQLVGIVSLGDLAVQADKTKKVGKALEGISAGAGGGNAAQAAPISEAVGPGDTSEFAYSKSRADS